MKIEQMDLRTIKIELTENDMLELAITYDEMDYQSPSTRKAILEIMHRVQKKIELDIETNKIFIEAFPSEDGGCILFINLVELKPQNKSTEKKCESLTAPLIFAFSDLNILVSACHRLRSTSVATISKSKLMLYDHSYILLIYTSSKTEETTSKLLLEYAEFLGKGPIKYAFFLEHSKLLIPSLAIETLLHYIG